MAGRARPVWPLSPSARSPVGPRGGMRLAPAASKTRVVPRHPRRPCRTGSEARRGWQRLRYTLAALVENHFGVLARVASLISGRGFNIESLAVGPAEDRALARMTIVLEGEPAQRDQLARQLGKLVDVLAVHALDADSLVARELALCKVRCPPGSRASVLQVADVFRARVVDAGADSLTLEVTGTEDKISAMIGLLDGEDHGVLEVARTGRVALARGARALAGSSTEVL